MADAISGIHHVTAICSDARQNYTFYSGILGLRLVKRTVNFDDPETYHLYYGDSAGHPGTILTFFSWPGAGRGRLGSGQMTATSFAVPLGSISYWQSRLKEQEIAATLSSRFGEQVLTFSDPDGMVLELIASESPWTDRTYTAGPVPPEHAIRGFHSATFCEQDHHQTAHLLTATMGLKAAGQDGDRYRFSTQSAEPGSLVDIVVAPDKPFGRISVGSVHHVAWRARDDQQQSDWLKTLIGLGHQVSPIMDRVYFQSIYFREPGGILFEVATDPPGFTLDEPLSDLGLRLKLPPWLEVDRAAIEKKLPTLTVPAQVNG